MFWIDKTWIHVHLSSSSGEVYPALVKFQWLDKFLLYTVTGWNIAFLVPESCRENDKKKGKSIRTRDRGHHWKRLKQCLLLLFWENLAVFVFLTAQDKYNNIIHIFIYLHSLQNELKKGLIKRCFSSCFLSF